jgi:hypothetical protein
MGALIGMLEDMEGKKDADETPTNVEELFR